MFKLLKKSSVIRESLVEVINKSGETKKEIARQINVSQQSLSDWTTLLNTKPVTLENGQALTDHFRDSDFTLQVIHEFFGLFKSIDGDVYRRDPSSLDKLQMIESDERKQKKQEVEKILLKQVNYLTVDDRQQMNHMENMDEYDTSENDSIRKKVLEEIHRDYPQLNSIEDYISHLKKLYDDIQPNNPKNKKDFYYEKWYNINGEIDGMRSLMKEINMTDAEYEFFYRLSSMDVHGISAFGNVKASKNELALESSLDIKLLESLMTSYLIFSAKAIANYLVDIANQAVRKFGMSGITSGYRPGDPYWHGKHQAIDIAYPSSMNGSSKYFDPANWVFENFADKVGYVITQGKVRDRTGQSGQPATGSWEPWPDNDHYDHLHITGKLGSGDIFKAGGGSSPAGSGAERWRSQVIEAAKMVGFPTDKGHIDRIISQIQTESGGNEKAVQGGYTDINTITGDLAKGLMQTISATFNAYKMPGHGNIFNGYDSILAGLRYIMAQYGTGAGFFANIGMGHGYADGGEINGPELAWIGEDPAYPKEFMINPAKPSADDLIIKAIRSREQFRPASANNVSSNSSGFLTSEISESSLQKLSQALNNRPVEVISHLDGKKVSKSVDEYTGSSLARKLYMRGKNFNG